MNLINYYKDGTINKLMEPLIISQNIKINKLPPSSYRKKGFFYGRFKSFDMINDLDIYGEIIN